MLEGARCCEGVSLAEIGVEDLSPAKRNRLETLEARP